jgi:hypothetical protein
MREELIIESNEERIFRNRLTFLSIKNRKRNTARCPATLFLLGLTRLSEGGQGRGHRGRRQLGETVRDTE